MSNRTNKNQEEPEFFALVSFVFWSLVLFAAGFVAGALAFFLAEGGSP